MQIILMEKVVNLGQLGDIVNVKNGYARNYLIPQGKAKRATEQAKAEFEAKRAELEKTQAKSLAFAQALAEILVQISQKAGHDGKLFGSVTNVGITEALIAQGFDIQKSMLRMPNGPLKTVGDHTLSIALHTDVTAHITVSVLGDTAT